MEFQLTTLSDLYRQDLPQGALFFAQEGTSNHFYDDGVEVSEMFRNDGGRFNMFDHFAPIPRLRRKLQPQDFYAVAGDFLDVFSEVKPTNAISKHWLKKLGQKAAWKWGFPGDVTKPHLPLFPMEHLNDSLYAFDPNMHYNISSKLFIPQIRVNQPAVQDPLSPCFPCVVKIEHGSGNRGTFMAHDAHEYTKIMNNIKKCEPQARIIVTDVIQDIVNNFCCHFYLNKQGEMTWLGSTEQVMDEHGHWGGATVAIADHTKFEALLKPTLQPVAATLHSHGYFGVVGVDVLVDKDGGQWVIDINPRVNASTPMLIISRLMGDRGWTVGIFIRGVIFAGTCQEMFEQAERAVGGEIVILSVYERGETQLCSCAIFSSSNDKCQHLLTVFEEENVDS